MALLEQRPDPNAFKRVCGHFIQSSAVSTLERLGLLKPIEELGGVRSHIRLWTRWGWILPCPDSALPRGVNLRRERLDPLVRTAAAETPGVELMPGYAARGLLADGGRFCGVDVVTPGGDRHRLRARLVVGADGRDSRIAHRAGVRTRCADHGRFSYAGYYEGPPPARSPDATIWMTDPHWAAAFPTDSGLTLYACMPTLDRLPEFKHDRAAAMEAFVGNLPDAPPIRRSRRVSPVIGKIKMPNLHRDPVAPGLALVGDAALATDPLWGVGCGWAFQSAEWLADSLAPALAGDEELERGLRRYRRRHRLRLAGHAFLIHDYAVGRKFNAVERLLYAGAVHDEQLAERLAELGTRNRGVSCLLGPSTVGRALMGGARHAFAKRLDRSPFAPPRPAA